MPTGTSLKEELTATLIAAIESGSENQHVEFKDGRSGSVSGELWRAISAFSNDPEGGVIFFGVAEINSKPQIVGLPNLGLFQEKVSNYFSNKMINALPPEIHTLQYGDQNLLAVIIKPIPNNIKPCYFKEKGMQNGACIRVGNSNRELSEFQLRDFIRNSAPFRFDKTVVPNLNINALDETRIEDFLEKSSQKAGRSKSHGITEQLLVNLGIAAYTEDRILSPTIGGYLLFSKEDPLLNRDFGRYCIHCIRYGGTDPSSPIVDKADITGTLDIQIEEVKKFILRNIPLKASISGTKRVEEYAYPESAIREIVANAIIHRDYQTTETYAKIVVFSDRIEISNPGTLPPGVTVENLKTAQYSRNETIAQLLKDMDYMEEYGRGIPIVYSEMNRMGLLEPIFRNSSNTFKVILLGEKFSTLNERQIQTWHNLQKSDSMNSFNINEYAKLFGISRPTATLDINHMIKLGLLVKRGAGPTTHYETVLY